MTAARALLLGLGACVSLLILVRDWRPALLLLFAAALAMAGFLRQEMLTARALPVAQAATTLVAIELTTAITAVLILLVTGLAYNRDYNLENLDEFGLLELSRAARRAARLNLPSRWSDYRFPSLALILVIAATFLLPRFYPFEIRDVDYAWTLLLLGGVLLLATADTLLKIGFALLLLAFGLKLFYLGIARRVGLIEFALLNLVTIVLALITAYLSGRCTVASKLLIARRWSRDNIGRAHVRTPGSTRTGMSYS